MVKKITYKNYYAQLQRIKDKVFKKSKGVIKYTFLWWIFSKCILADYAVSQNYIIDETEYQKIRKEYVKL